MEVFVLAGLGSLQPLRTVAVLPRIYAAENNLVQQRIPITKTHFFKVDGWVAGYTFPPN